MARRTRSKMVWLRRASQTGFLLAFLYLFLQAVYKPINQTGKGVKLFFQLDPLPLLTPWLGTRQVVSGLSLGLATLAVTVLAGRWFCGWICPFGALHNLLTGWRRNRARDRIAAGGYSRWQKSKYYLLAGILTGALLGLNLVGWLDPFSFFYRSLATVVFPAANDAARSVFTAIYDADPGIGKVRVTAVSEPVYEWLRRHFLATAQPHYYGTLLVALLFLAAVFLNLYRARFWCRYVCPLGALLGTAGKNPLVRLRRSAETCNDCGLCLADCQGGATPSAAGGWKPSECFYCGNCRAACPQQAIEFVIGPAKDGRP